MTSPLDIMIRANRDKASLDALSSGLRRRKDVATLALLSGDPSASKLGETLYGDVETKVAQRVSEQDKKAQRDLTQGYYNQLGSQFDKTLTETTRHNKAMEQAAMLRASMARVKKPTDTAMKDASSVVQSIQNINSLIKEFKDSYGNQSSWNPLAGTLKNTLGASIYATNPNQVESKDWWAKYQLMYELPERNRMFGSALTAPEQLAWKRANITPNSPPNVIRNGLSRLKKIADGAVSRMATQHAMVYDPDWVATTYAPVHESLKPPSEEPSSPSPSTAQNTRVRWEDE